MSETATTTETFALCTRCGEEKTARGGDIHCSGDCDHFQHDEPGGCHTFAAEKSGATS